MDRRFMYMKNFVPKRLSAPALGCIHGYYDNIHISLKRLGQSNPKFGASLGRGNVSLYKWSWSHAQDGCHGYK